MKALLDLDRSLFRLLNGKWHNGFFDAVMPFVRDRFTWIPLYVFLFAFILANFRKRWWLVLYAVLTPVLTDLLSSRIIKETVYRIRPCSEPELIGEVRQLALYCPGSSSFTSSHAANHFGLATFLAVALYPVLGRRVYAGILWAALIAYAQIYVGVHYPTDVAGGALVGAGAGWLMATVFRKQLGPDRLERL
ncbi:phosphatase PAP2 family protein [Flaviaesturariibacter amylovorans]|uniref:Phosphatase PAP2 family protein n=1 Tax=Flaviaesturariibacter amylovorans TaxID=1084520 RepID=A0ABP8G9Q9_9BACT